MTHLIQVTVVSAVGVDVVEQGCTELDGGCDTFGCPHLGMFVPQMNGEVQYSALVEHGKSNVCSVASPVTT